MDPHTKPKKVIASCRCQDGPNVVASEMVPGRPLIVISCFRKGPWSASKSTNGVGGATPGVSFGIACLHQEHGEWNLRHLLEFPNRHGSILAYQSWAMMISGLWSPFDSHGSSGC